MDVSYVNPFVKATNETFKTMMGMELKMGVPELKKADKHTFDISGVIGLSGEAQGIISLSFPEKLALQVVSKLLGAEITTVGADLTDAIGEIANIVAGYAKQYLTQFKLSISLPNVVIGSNHKIAVQSGIAVIIVPFSCELGTFAMEVALKTP